VVVSLGAPPTHRTPTLESNQWIYWLDRFRSRVLTFGVDGRLTDIR
jgi:hypothetical protein